MKFKTEAAITGHDGDIVKDNDGENMDLRMVACNALLANYQDEITGEEKVRRYELAKKIAKEDEVDLLPSDCKLIRDLVNKLYGAGVVGPVWSLIPDEEKAKANEAREDEEKAEAEDE